MRIKFIQEYESNGQTYRYYRRKGAPRIPISLSLSGIDLALEVERLNKQFFKPNPLAGTLRLLVVDYKKNSNHFRSLRDRTRVDYERVFKWLGDAMDAGLHEIGTPDIAKVRDKARDMHEAKFANQVVTTLKMVFAHGVEYGAMDKNPALGVSKATGGNKKPNRACEPWEAASLIDNAPAHLKPAIAIAIYTGLRLGDVVKLGKSADKGEWLETVQSKTGRMVLTYICPDLRAILNRIEYATEFEVSTICIKSNGQPWAYEGLKTAWGRYIGDLEAKGTIDPGVTFHGLRHTPATILEGNGFDEMDTRHFLGHGPKTVSGRYGVNADRRELLKSMALTIESALRAARGNVLRMERK